MRSRVRWALALIPTALLITATLWSLPLALFALRPIRETLSSSGVESPPEAFVLVERGSTPGGVVNSLHKAGYPVDAPSLILLGRLRRSWGGLKVGEYRIAASQTPLEILDTLTSGVSVKRPVTVREGENMYEVAAAIDRAGLAPKGRVLELCRDPEFIRSVFKAQKNPGAFPTSLEGFLFPDTYHFNRLQTPEEMLNQMVRRYRQVWSDLMSRSHAVNHLSEIEVITLASIIEKETGAQEERPLISSVFHNRLKKRMRLQSDPTTIYGIWERYDGNIQKQDLLTPTAYNTYKIPALPIGPISNPGLLSIEAALNPAASEFLYFVSRNEGHHVFTRTYKEHQAAVKDFQLNRAAREGRSWRELRRSGQKN